jgi:3-dehydroquinate synthase
VWIGSGLLESIGDWLPEQCSGKRCCIISDNTVYSLYGKNVTTGLISAGCDVVEPFVIEPGESSKSMNVLRACYKHLLDQKMDRDSMIVTLGGGVPGDLGGFAAATFMRGIPFVQIPTTLLAQADASIGGKTGINLEEGKNLIGAFHQPLSVISDLCTLNTLPARHIRNGLAEIVKMAVLGSETLFEQIETNAHQCLALKMPELAQILTASCILKAGIVERDETDKGIRTTLNLGHTIGHALETADNFSSILHGEAVALGMIAVSHISVLENLLDRNTYRRIRALLSTLKLTVSVRDIDVHAVFSSLDRDKKSRSGSIHFVLPVKLGQTQIKSDISRNRIEQGIRSILDTGIDEENPE